MSITTTIRHLRQHVSYCKKIIRTASKSLATTAVTSEEPKDNGDIVIGSNAYKRDEWTTISSRVLKYVGMKLHQEPFHPLTFTKKRIVDYMYSRFKNNRGNPLFSVYENISPVVSVEKNFDSLNIPQDHPSRKKSDTYYINAETVLRGHTSAHQSELIKSGLDNFLVIGDVYRKDQIDSCHYPVFHQVEAVRLRSQHQLFQDAHEDLGIFEKGHRTDFKQENHTLEAVKLMEHEMKTCLVGLMECLFGKDVKCRWVHSTFPFTHPSFELEIALPDGKWMEMLGCGIMEHNLLTTAGAAEKIGWAFGLGLERLAMILYSIPDIRLFWTMDSGFRCQFEGKDANTPITFKPFSKHPQCSQDMSFWIPSDFSPNDFYEIVRDVAGDAIEHVEFIDEFFHPKVKRVNHTYRLIYRHMERAYSHKEVAMVHKRIGEIVTSNLKVVIRT